MATRRLPVFALVVAAFFCSGASYRTANFLVEAPTPQIAQQIGQMAEHYRREKALQWLGQEMPPWPEPCPLRAKVTMGGAGGATSFAFDRGRVLGQTMTIEGSLERLLNSVLPHEITHTVFAFYFRCPVPRWADEGGAVLSEDEVERQRHDQLVRQILNTPGRAIPLRRLFALKEYPGDVMVLYAEGFSVTQFLVERSSRPTFLAFVQQGMIHGWDHAVRQHYHYQNVEELEQAWLAHLRATKRSPTQLAQTLTAPTPAPPPQVPVQAIATAQPAPVFRGQAPANDLDQERFGATGQLASNRPGYLPEVLPSPGPNPTPAPPAVPFPDGWQAPVQLPSPPVVQLGPPQSIPWPAPSTRENSAPPPAPAAPPPAVLGRPSSRTISPIGYPE
jgi:hypothetical protein